MKRLIKKLFKKEPQFNYIVAEYQPAKHIAPPKDLNHAKYDTDEPNDKDEMEIDRIYQNS
jgi:hypothetical protein